MVGLLTREQSKTRLIHSHVNTSLKLYHKLAAYLPRALRGVFHNEIHRYFLLMKFFKATSKQTSFNFSLLGPTSLQRAFYSVTHDKLGLVRAYLQVKRKFY